MDPYAGHLVYDGLQELIDYITQINGKPINIGHYYGTKMSAKMACDYILRGIKPKLFYSMKAPVYEFETDAKNMFCHLEDEAALGTVAAGVDLLRRAVAAFAMGGHGAAAGAALAGVGAGMKTIEAGKVSTFIKEAKTRLLANPRCKVIIMLNYLDSIALIKEGLKEFKPLMVQGSVKQELRPDIVKKFQEHNANHRVLISNLRILCQGVDLDDQHGNYPRTLLISPSYHVIDLHQATGRILRSKTKSLPEVRFIYIAKVAAEMKLLHKLAEKSNVIKSSLNYVVNLPGDYEHIYEREEDIPPEKRIKKSTYEDEEVEEEIPSFSSTTSTTTSSTTSTTTSTRTISEFAESFYNEIVPVI
jgi:subtilisin-like proprotein convertase family protein